MEGKNVPIGKKVVLSDNKHIKAVFTRSTQKTGLFEMFSQDNGSQVLSVIVDIDSGNFIDGSFDFSFWTVYQDGTLIGSGSNPEGKMEANAKDRVIKFTT